MEHLYNPDLMSDSAIKGTFVARQALLDELVNTLADQPTGAGVQHSVIVAPRGMGKTTILLMLQFAVRDSALAEQWQTVRFPEESYGINDLADFWLTVIRLLAEDTRDGRLKQRADELSKRYPDPADLRDVSYALVKDWSRQSGRRLLLLVDNFDQILEQINDMADNSALRNVLMNDGTVALVGGATSFFLEARAYDQPLYNFFKIHHLLDLTFDEMVELLKLHAEQDYRADVTAILAKRVSKLRVLHYFTAGNPRLILMLYRILVRSEIAEAQIALEKLLDEVTPYYKAKTESLAPQQRRILDFIAKESSRTSEGVTPADAAAATRLKPNVVSTQLGRLADLGYVRSAHVRGRQSYYALSEPLYAIWYQMRFGTHARQKMRWLVDFLQGWFDATELREESARLSSGFERTNSTGSKAQAGSILIHWSYVVEAIGDTSESSKQYRRLMDACVNIGSECSIDADILGKEDYGPRSRSTATKVMDRPDQTTGSRTRALNHMETPGVSLLKAAIADAEVEDRLLPLIKAIQYASTGDESILERLAPEIRPITTEIAAALREVDHGHEQSRPNHGYGKNS